MDQPELSEPSPEFILLIRNSIEQNFDKQLKFLSDFVSIPSLRSEEAPAQDFISEALNKRGYEVDAWQIKIEELEPLPGFGQVNGDFSRARSVVGTHRPKSSRGRSLILQGHLDVVPAGPLDMWRNRGAGDMKAGTVAGLFALDAIKNAGFDPAARLHFLICYRRRKHWIGRIIHSTAWLSS